MKIGWNNIFISHYYKDDGFVHSLKERLINSGYYVKNFSVDSTNHKDGRRPKDEVIKRLLDIRIRRASTFICILGTDTYTRKWVNYEIRKAYIQGKKIIGVYPHGCKNNVELPAAFKKYGGATIGWNSVDKLGEIIRGETTIFENPDGSQRTPTYTIERIAC